MFFLKVIFFKLLMLGLKVAVKFIPQNQPIIFSGQNSSLSLAQLIIDQGALRVLIVTDSILNNLGIADDICQRLRQQNVEVIIFDKVTPDPNENIVENGIRTIRQHNCDLVLGIGGGSSLDAAKMIAVLAVSGQSKLALNTRSTNCLDSQPQNIKSVKDVAGILKIKQRGLPLFLLPTTSGTGSEVTMAAVITDSFTETKSLVISPHIMPIATALDPILMQGMPAKITADTGFDALTHAIEAYLSTHANEQTNLYALCAIKLIFKSLPSAYQNGSDLAARESLALASCYAGLAFTKAGLGYVHAISHQLGAKYHLPHGMTNAVILPHVLEFNLTVSQARLSVLAKAISGPEQSARLKEMDQAKQAEYFLEKVRELQQSVNIEQTISAINLEDLESIAKGALKEAHYLYPVPKYLTLNQCKSLLRKLMPAEAVNQNRNFNAFEKLTSR